ncbi:MAG: DUF433 domain-containing protein [Akkermansiaceae bacterium]|nr:DUF433 domain-containing protein [Akkermansiaceae bacterium]
MVTLDHSPVHSDPGILGGALVFRGTRVKAQTLLDQIKEAIETSSTGCYIPIK